jgi:hypothetical protein
MPFSWGFSWGQARGYLRIRVVTVVSRARFQEAIYRWHAPYPFGSFVESGTPL